MMTRATRAYLEALSELVHTEIAAREAVTTYHHDLITALGEAQASMFEVIQAMRGILQP